MGSHTRWYYKPTNSPRYPGVRPKDTFLTEFRALGMPMNSSGKSIHTVSMRSPEQYKEWLTRMSRHTTSSASKFEFPRLSLQYQNRYMSWDGKFQWNKMALQKDSEKVLWNKDGAVKQSYQK